MNIKFPICYRKNAQEISNEHDIINSTWIFPVSFSANPKCTLTPMLSKITEPLLYSFNTDVMSLFTLCNIPNQLVYRLT